MPCYNIHTRQGLMSLHGDLGEPCADCGDVGSLLCDYPVGGGKTCDRKLCEAHGNLVGDDIHYCRSHYREWCDNNPSKKTYQHTQIRAINLPGMALTVMMFLKREFSRRDPGVRCQQVDPFLCSSALPLGRDGREAAEGSVEGAPHESLSAGLQWCLNYRLIEIHWKQQRGAAALPRFALTRAGLSVLEGGHIEVESESEVR
ncbi:MAG: hypothetical protein GX771_10780 [Halomonadaceae bacterium]|nr:hypothetical protein [Halomonadaceae bacterium]